ncbi:ABC transporter permease [Pseudomonas sp. CAN2814]|uniref:FtsX-like permease family protein n=1 Tax=Pseudomonas sp. CAN1 TaxID=3046726 RepID=UPI00264713AE|nr:FtsX-like permease family protein [Pseudomonas sp. CAN1]MDN6859254.1 ABC transporter permease [Pseudomonas sp. CAN1]
MRLPLVASLAWQDYRNDWRLSACAVLALVAVLAPLLVLFGLKFGLVGSLTERLQRDAGVREIIPLGGARFDAAYVAALAARPDVAFAVPRTRQIAASVQLSLPGREALTAEMIPTAVGDPLLGGLPVPNDLQDVLLSQTAAEKLGVRAGDSLQALLTRQNAGRDSSRALSLRVLGVLPLEAFGRDALFAAPGLLEAAEDFRDGLAVDAFGWPGEAPGERAQRIYPAFRLYARGLDDVEPLRRYFAGQGVEVFTQAAAIERVQSLSRNLTLVFWLIAALALAGAFAAICAGALAAVQRKRRELAVLRLVGFGTSALLAFVVLQALYSSAFAALLAAALYRLAQGGLNRLFVAQPGEHAAQLLPTHYLVAVLAVLAASLLAALLGGWRVCRIDAAQGVRDV